LQYCLNHGRGCIYTSREIGERKNNMFLEKGNMLKGRMGGGGKKKVKQIYEFRVRENSLGS